MENLYHVLNLSDEAKVLLGSYFDLSLDIEHQEATIKSEGLNKKRLVTQVNLEAELATVEKRIELKNLRKALLTHNIIIL